MRWAVLGSDRDRPGHHVAVVAFGGYAEAMANSGHPATEAFGKELQSICTGEPRFRNLDVAQRPDLLTARVTAARRPGAGPPFLTASS